MTVGQPKLVTVSIDDVTVDTYLIGEKTEENWEQEVGNANIVLIKAVDNIITLNENIISKSVTIQRGVNTATEEYVFRGEVLSYAFTGGYYIIKCKDKLYETVREEATKSFDKNIDTEAGVISEIFKTLINDYTTLTADDSTVHNSGTIFTRDKFICDHADIFPLSKKLANYIGYFFYYDAGDDKVYFQPRGYQDSSITLEVGNNIVEKPKWNYNGEKLVNVITIIGAEIVVETTEYFNGDGSTVSFNLLHIPKSVKVWAGAGVYDPANGTAPSDDSDNLEVGGKSNSTSGSYDYSVDIENQNVDFESGSIPANGTKSVEVRYSYAIPTPVTLKNQVSIDKLKTATHNGEHKKTIFRDDLKSVSDAENFAQTNLDKYSEAFVGSTLKIVNTYGLNAGELVRCIDNQAGVDRWLLITKKISAFPYRYDAITVGDEIYKEAEWELGAEERIRRLEEANASSSSDLLLHVISLNRTIELHRRYFKLMKKTYQSGDNVFMLGHPDFGVLGTNVLGDSSGREEILKAMVPGNMVWKEYIYDNDFTESGTTATVNTTLHQVEF